MKRATGLPGILMVMVLAIAAVATQRSTVAATETPESLYLQPLDCPGQQISQSQFSYGDLTEARGPDQVAKETLTDLQVDARHPGVALRPKLTTSTDRVFTLVTPSTGDLLGLIHLQRSIRGWHIELLQECS